MIKLKIKYGNEYTDLRFPCTEKEMNAALERIHAEDVTPFELYVSEVIFPEELGCLQDRFVNLDEVNFLGKRMDGFFGDEEYQFYEAMKSEGFDTLPDLINLSFNLNRYPLIRDISDMGKIGREYLLTVKGCLPADDEDDPKYAEFGRELIQFGKGVFTEHGLLFVNENTPFQKLYDGQVFPPYVYDSDVLCIARADYNGKSEYLYLPCEEKAIEKALARLGAAPENAKIIFADENTPFIAAQNRKCGNDVLRLPFKALADRSHHPILCPARKELRQGRRGDHRGQYAGSPSSAALHQTAALPKRFPKHSAAARS